MNAQIYHIQINVSDAKKSIPFYKQLLCHLGFKIIDESPSHIGASNKDFGIWVIETENKYKENKFHRKATGINHIAFKASSKAEVDKFASSFMRENKISPLYGSPKPFPEYHKDYYAVFFEDPDRLKLELAYAP